MAIRIEGIMQVLRPSHDYLYSSNPENPENLSSSNSSLSSVKDISSVIYNIDNNLPGLDDDSGSCACKFSCTNSKTDYGPCEIVASNKVTNTVFNDLVPSIKLVCEINGSKPFEKIYNSRKSYLLKRNSFDLSMISNSSQKINITASIHNLNVSPIVTNESTSSLNLKLQQQSNGTVFKCEICDFNSRTKGRLRRHKNEYHDKVCHQMSKIVKRKKPTTHPLKIYVCKICNHNSTGKDRSWEHNKIHMLKGKKVYACNDCNFLTEHKHHHDYHIKSHISAKAFKCPKCNYTCINRSMLNSHMKSHSDHYGFKCQDCSYSTKYRHSLKIHIKKYRHEPCLDYKDSDDCSTLINFRKICGSNINQHGHANLEETYDNTFDFDRSSPVNRKIMSCKKLFSDKKIAKDFKYRYDYGSDSQIKYDVDTMKWLRYAFSISDDDSADNTQVFNNKQLSQTNHNYVDYNTISKYFNESLPFIDKTLITKSYEERRSPDKNLDLDGNGMSDRHYGCKHCDIYFKDGLLFKMHMSYHSEGEPFKCNLCNHRTDDRFSFFTHIAQIQH